VLFGVTLLLTDYGMVYHICRNDVAGKRWCKQ